MTKSERQYLVEQIEHNKKVIKLVEDGKCLADIYTTNELKLAFVQGLNYANEVFDKYING